MIDLKSRDPRAIRIALLVILGITLWRVLWLALSRVELYVDEAQYWHWGQELAFGYFSKPPLIGWLIRGMNELSGSDGVFWIRLASPLLYGLTSLIILWAARQVWPDEPAAWAAGVFATMPGIGVLALFISTDDLLLFCFALALLAILKLTRGASIPWAIVLGVAVGAGLMAKYAMIYFVVLAALVVAIFASVIVVRRDAIIAAVTALLIAAPNLWWNIANGFITFAHTAENADWGGIRWNWAGLGELALTQIIAFGPIFAAVYIALVAWPTKYIFRPANWLLVGLSLPIFVVVSGQALIEEANGNWAAPAFVGATVLTIPWLALFGRVWLYVGAGVNLALAVVLPILTAFPNAQALGIATLFERAQGVRALSEEAIAIAERDGVAAIISNDRRMLADLTYRTKGSEIEVYAEPTTGTPASHYQLTRPAPDGLAPVLLLTATEPPETCSAERVAEWNPGTGSFRRGGLTIWVARTPCY